MMIRDSLIRAILPRTALGPADAGGGEARRKRYRPWAWLCVAASAGLAATLLALLEPSFWRALLVAFFLACPAIAIWGLFAGLRPLPFPIGDVPATRGRTLNWLAPYYDFVCRLTGLGPRFRERIRELARFQPGETVLDIGCGTGVTTHDAAAAVGQTGAVWGIDPAPDMIRIAMVKNAKLGSRARFTPGVVERLTTESASIDIAILSLVLHLLPQDLQREGLREVWRVLRPGGRLLIVAWASSPTEVLLRDAGFAPVERAGQWNMAIKFWLAWKPVLGEAE